jgi:hypothetical protein
VATKLGWNISEGTCMGFSEHGYENSRSTKQEFYIILLLTMFLALAPFILADSWQRFGEIYRLHLQGSKWKPCFSETSESAHESTRSQNQERHHHHHHIHCRGNLRRDVQGKLAGTRQLSEQFSCSAEWRVTDDTALMCNCKRVKPTISSVWYRDSEWVEVCLRVSRRSKCLWGCAHGTLLHLSEASINWMRASDIREDRSVCVCVCVCVCAVVRLSDVHDSLFLRGTSGRGPPAQRKPGKYEGHELGSRWRRQWSYL